MADIKSYFKVKFWPHVHDNAGGHGGPHHRQRFMIRYGTTDDYDEHTGDYSVGPTIYADYIWLPANLVDSSYERHWFEAPSKQNFEEWRKEWKQ